MLGENSCVAWGYEFIAKWHEVLPFDEFPIQRESALGLGFSAEDRRDFLGRFGIEVQERHVSIDELETLIISEAKKQLPPIVRIFSKGTIQYVPSSDGLIERANIWRDYHCFVGFEEHGEAFLAGRLFSREGKDSGPIFLRWGAVQQIESMSSKLTNYSPIACLLHTSPLAEKI